MISTLSKKEYISNISVYGNGNRSLYKKIKSKLDIDWNLVDRFFDTSVSVKNVLNSNCSDDTKKIIYYSCFSSSFNQETDEETIRNEIIFDVGYLENKLIINKMRNFSSKNFADEHLENIKNKIEQCSIPYGLSVGGSNDYEVSCGTMKSDGFVHINGKMYFLYATYISTTGGAQGSKLRAQFGAANANKHLNFIIINDGDGAKKLYKQQLENKLQCKNCHCCCVNLLPKLFERL